MIWTPPEPDDDDAERLAIVLAPRMTERMQALLKLTLLPKDRELVEAMMRRDPKTLGAEHRHWVQQLLWRYRRDLPRGLRPKLNPDDPIVRAMEEAGV